MKRNGSNLVHGFITGCALAAIIVSLAGKVNAEEIVRSSTEKSTLISSQNKIDGVYKGIRGHAGYDVRLLKVSDEGLDDYFVITGTFRSKSNAYRRAYQNGGRVVRTSEYPNMTNGYYAVVFGPYTELLAYQVQANRGLRGYIKSGW